MLICDNAVTRIAGRSVALLYGVFLSSVITAFPSASADGNFRYPYQRVIDEKYPGFRILDKNDLDEPIFRDSIRDGEMGYLIMGYFNFDKKPDFAAIIASETLKGPPDARFGTRIHDGGTVVCLGAGARGQFDCNFDSNPEFRLPTDQYLAHIPPGVVHCYPEGNDYPDWKKIPIKTETDSIEQGVLEKGAGAEMFRRDGSTYSCITSD